MPHDGFKHIDRLASNAKVLLWLHLIYYAGMSALSLEHPSSSSSHLHAAPYDLLLNGLSALALLTAVIFFAWYQRTSANANKLNPGVQNYGEIAGIACFFVPIINLVAPYLVITELWQASLIQPNPLSKGTRFLVKLCWLSWLGSVVIRWLTYEQLNFSYSRASEVFGTTTSTIALTIATILLTRIISQISNDQNRTFAVKASQVLPSTEPAPLETANANVVSTSENIEINSNPILDKQSR